MKRLYAILFVLVLTLGCLTARQKTEIPADTPVQATEAPTPADAREAISTAFRKNQAVQSVHMDTVSDMSYTISIPEAGYAQPLTVRTEMHIDSDGAAERSKTEGTTSSLGQSVKTLVYSERKGDTYYSYASTDNGRTWTTVTQDAAAYEKMSNPGYMMSLWQQCIKTAEASGAATVNGRETTLYTGFLSGDYLSFTSGGVGQMLEGYSESEINAFMSGLRDMPFEVNVDSETGYIVRFRVDMSDAMTTLLKNLMEAEMQKNGTPVSVEIRNTSIITEAVYSQFDAIAPIEIPAAARH